ncbi:MAG: prepilin peptidase, partial [Brevundimonas sp.]
QSVALGALIGLAALLVGMALFALNWLGGGDAKIMAAIVPFMGLAALPQFLLFTALAGGALSLGLMAARGFAPSLPVGPVWIGRLMDARGPLPYGVAICVGALAAYPASTIGQAAFGG